MEPAGLLGRAELVAPVQERLAPQAPRGLPDHQVQLVRPEAMGHQELQDRRAAMELQVLQEAMVLMAPAGRMDQQGLQEPADRPVRQERQELRVLRDLMAHQELLAQTEPMELLVRQARPDHMVPAEQAGLQVKWGPAEPSTT